MQIGGVWCRLFELSGVWSNLVEFDATWFFLVQFGAAWCFLVHFGQGVRKVSFTSTGLKVIFTRPEKLFREQNKK